jgi:hypothetical protein
MVRSHLHYSLHLFNRITKLHPGIAPVPPVPRADLPRLSASTKTTSLTRTLASLSPKSSLSPFKLPAPPPSPSRSPSKSKTAPQLFAIPFPFHVWQWLEISYQEYHSLPAVAFVAVTTSRDRAHTAHPENVHFSSRRSPSATFCAPAGAHCRDSPQDAVFF